MQEIHFQDVLVHDRKAGLANRRQLEKTAHQWNKFILHELRQFAARKWSDLHVLKVIPVHAFRLRKNHLPESISWWVEHDIPPFDRYHCEAYLIELTLKDSGQPQLLIRTGSSTYPVIPMNREGFRQTLLKASADQPMIIFRDFGPAIYP